MPDNRGHGDREGIAPDVHLGNDEGGDPACWLARVCSECGLFVEGAMPAVCPRCGAEFPADGGELR